MNKESTLKIARVLHDTRQVLVSVTAERDKLAAENAAFKRRGEATKVASMLHDKGIDLDTPFDALVENLEKQAEAGRLPEIARAAEMIGPSMSFGSTNNDEVMSQGANDVLTNYLVGSVG
jgi:hypothetical protein